MTCISVSLILYLLFQGMRADVHIWLNGLNFRLIDKLHRNRVFSYAIRDLKKIDSLLTNLCLNLRLNYKIILAPLGPKPFALCCLILSARYPDIEVWRVSAGSSESVYNREPFGEPLIYRVDFGLEEDYA